MVSGGIAELYNAWNDFFEAHQLEPDLKASLSFCSPLIFRVHLVRSIVSVSMRNFH